MRGFIVYGSVLLAGAFLGGYLVARSQLALTSVSFSTQPVNEGRIREVNLGHHGDPRSRIVIDDSVGKLSLQSKHGTVEILNFRKDTYRKLLDANYPTAMVPTHNVKFSGSQADQASFHFEFYRLDCSFAPDGTIKTMDIWSHQSGWGRSLRR